MKTLLSIFSALAILAMAVSGPATTHADETPFIAGEITKVDEKSNRLTIRHGPMPHLSMNEGMMMVFKVADPAMVASVSVGDKVEFKAERIRGDLTVVEIRK